jgi:hypothetical protein
MTAGPGTLSPTSRFSSLYTGVSTRPLDAPKYTLCVVECFADEGEDGSIVAVPRPSISSKTDVPSVSKVLPMPRT